ncbi:hypothetical protein R1sor_006545 [Riccia sorocarpa]|uniref:Reverse transcriptase domain-containing protein n=1 Tax=Riccia sorocarpa TaxID=122646 RepID=A0ABD3HRC7_9MARC
MKLVLGSFNVIGLCSRTARTRLRNFIQGTRPNRHILAIHEYKLRDIGIDFLTKSIWPQANFFTLPATDGVHAIRNPTVTSGKGGVIVAVAPSVASLVTNNGTLPRNGGIWLHIETPDGRKLGLAAVYAPNAASDRALLWQALENTLDPTRHWIMAGDYNMITDAHDQFGGTTKLISGEECTHWNGIINSLDLHDTFQRIDGSLKYTWDNRRLAFLLAQQGQPGNIQDGGRILKRLDRVYIDSALCSSLTATNILPGTELSDHLPVVVTFHFGPPRGHSKSNYQMNTKALQDVKLKEQLVTHWNLWQSKYERSNTPPMLAFKYCIKRSAKYCQLWGKKKAVKRREKQNKLTLKLYGLMLQLQADPSNICTQLKIEEAQTELNTWEAEKARWTQLHLDKKWEDEGDRCSKLYFNSIKARKRQTSTHALQDAQGILHTEEDKILDLAVDYFSEILQEPPPDPSQQSALEEMLSHVQAKVTAIERDSLQAKFSLEELHTAAKLLGKNKCPGPDGVPLEFYLVMWETISPLLFKATEEGLQEGSMLPFYNRGIITLLQKEGDSSLLKNKRPITLLNAVYKIWAKALQLRLSPVLQRLITWEQNAFLPGRQLHTTVFLCNETLFEARRQNQDCVFLKIDFRKAFDTIRWDFLYATMRKMEFGETFTALVATLNNSASSSVRINNACSESFQISRSVRQGCPLSPLLFTIVIQVLTDAVNRMISTGHLKGILLPSGLHYSQGFFADDAHLLLSADRQILRNAKILLDTYGAASGLCVQWTKSKAKWVSTATPLPDWSTELEWKWCDSDETEKLLGFQFKDEIDAEGIFETVRQKIQSKLKNPAYRSTSLHGRILIVNQLLYGLIWFVLPLWAANKAKLRSIEKMVLKFIWGGTEDTNTRHRVAEAILHQKKSDGGLGLISLQAQTIAFAAKIVRWAYVPGTHPLKTWLQTQFQAIASKRWDSSHLTWVATPSREVWPTIFPLLLHICSLWQSAAKLLAPLQHLPLTPWKTLSIWGPKTPGVRNVTRSATGRVFARLKGAGIENLGVITHDGTTSIPLHLAATTEIALVQTNLKAYERILDSTPKHTASLSRPSQFAISLLPDPLYCIKLKHEAPQEDSSINTSHAGAAFQVRGTELITAHTRDLPPTAKWSRAPVVTCWNSPKKPPDRYLMDWSDELLLTSALQWKDNSEFLAAPNAIIRSLVSRNVKLPKKRLQHWIETHHFDSTQAAVWTRLWFRNKPVKYSTLQWYILFQAVPTNTWRNPQLDRSNDETWCVGCDRRAAEDITHLFWSCPVANEIWQWAVQVLHLAFPDTRRWPPRFIHAVLGADPPDYCKVSTKWWEAWRSIILWIIWTLRNGKIFRNETPSPAKAKALAWFRLLLYSRKEWKHHCQKADAQDLTLARRTQLDRRVGKKLALFSLRTSTMTELDLTAFLTDDVPPVG